MSESRRRPNTFAGPHVQRHSAARRDTDTLRQLLSRGEAAVAPVWNSRLLVRRRGPGSACLLDPAHPALTGIGFERLVLLGEFAGRLVFAAEIEATTEPCLEPETGFIDLRTAGATLPHDQAGLLAYAGALIAWRRRHRHCGSCGAPTVPQQAGHVMACTSSACGAHSFPRIDPAVIVLVTDGERALLGRQSSWPPGRYSTVAGFVEPGESLEDAAAREVFEETGVPVVAPVYHSSQPWPFPSSLMLGFTATAASTEIHCADAELEDARWFTRAQVAAGTPILPPPLSIAYALIEHWFDAGWHAPLGDIIERDGGTRARW
ncbi:MAG: NAD(+) diphosphatase [Steroidobacteraceae bacterium]